MPEKEHMLHDAIAWALAMGPVLYGLAAYAAGRADAPRRAWRIAQRVAATCLALTVAAGIALAGTGAAIVSILPPAISNALGLSLRLDVPAVAMLLLVHFIALVILRYGMRYLDGETGQQRFVAWFLGTVASVAVLVLADHLALLLAGWLGASMCLHQLLTFYRDRPQALLAAHKKFLLTRLADVCLIAAFGLLIQAFGTLRLSEIFAALPSDGRLPAGLHVAGVLIAVATVLKCAQLPFHGWLIQVMEAPTPVSALLHAGVVNIGGFLLIRLAPLMAMAPAAQWLLVVVGGMTAVVAGLVMMTRVSVKVGLAWSTCAQMGFMLMECGLGAYALALLHLLAHSLYKAHCFLSAGRAARVCEARRMTARSPVPRLRHWAVAAVLGLAAVGLAAAVFGAHPDEEPALWALATVVTVGVTTLLGEILPTGRRDLLLRISGGGLAVAFLYFAWHHAMVDWVSLPLAAADPEPGTVPLVMVLFALQLALYATGRSVPDHRILRRVHAYLYHGLYLDELFTRLTFLLWPPRLTSRNAAEHHTTITAGREKLAR